MSRLLCTRPLCLAFSPITSYLSSATSPATDISFPIIDRQSSSHFYLASLQCPIRRRQLLRGQCPTLHSPIDPCWGAGHVEGKGQPYIAKFTPQYFTMSNEEFGIKHFPGNKDMFFLPEGRRMSWEEYIQINPASWPLQVEAPDR